MAGTSSSAASRTVIRLIRSDRYTIRGFVSTAIKHGLNPMTAHRGTLLGQPWMPKYPRQPEGRPPEPEADQPTGDRPGKLSGSAVLSTGRHPTDAVPGAGAPRRAGSSRGGRGGSDQVVELALLGAVQPGRELGRGEPEGRAVATVLRVADLDGAANHELLDALTLLRAPGCLHPGVSLILVSTR